MTPGFRAVVNRREGQGRNLFRRIRRIRRSAALTEKASLGNTTNRDCNLRLIVSQQVGYVFLSISNGCLHAVCCYIVSAIMG